jgi:hypothetical protein
MGFQSGLPEGDVVRQPDNSYRPMPPQQIATKDLLMYLFGQGLAAQAADKVKPKPPSVMEQLLQDVTRD